MDRDDLLDAVNAALDETPTTTVTQEDISDGTTQETGQPEQAPTEDVGGDDTGSAPDGLQPNAERLSNVGDSTTADDNKDNPDAEIAALSPRARQRFEKLTGELREKTEVHDQLRGLLNEHIADPADFAQILDYSKALKQGNYPQALRMLDKARQDLVLRTGLEAPVTDPLDAFPDLKAEVERFSISRERAFEVARARRAQMEQQQRFQQQSLAREQSSHYMGEAQAAGAEITRLEQAWKNSDPEFEVKIRSIAGKVDQIRQQYTPAQWPGVVRMLYEAQTAPAARPKLQAQPLRPLAGSQQARKPTPTTIDEAIAEALGW